MKPLSRSLIVALLVLCAPAALACTAFLVCGDGEVLFANNEDFWDPNTRIWFTPGENGDMGYVTVGYSNMYPQGGMNEAGLAYDGFATSANPVGGQEGKEKVDSTALIHDIMSTCATVEDVVSLLEDIDLRWLETAMLQFADAQGASVIIEGETFVQGDGRFQVCTNFYQSQTADDRAACPRFSAAMDILDGADKVSVSLCRKALAATAQEDGAQTLYSNVFDLKRQIIYLYNFHNFEDVVVFDLKEELAKGHRVLNIPDLFAPTFAYTRYLNKREAEQERKRQSMQVPPLKAGTLDRYVGTYALDVGDDEPQLLVFRREGRELVISSGGANQPLLPMSETKFFIIDDQGTRTFHFTQDSSGRFTKMETVLEGLGRRHVAQRVEGSSP